MNQRDRLHNVSSWLNDLANLTAGQAPLIDSKAKVATMAAALNEEFPLAAFTRQSLLVVARGCKFFPGYGEICAILSPWWLAHRPPPSQLAISQDDKRAKEEREEQERANSWRDITDEQVRAKIRALHGHPKRQELGHFLAIAVKRNAPAKLGILPPEWLDAPTEPAKVIAMRRPPPIAPDA